MIKPEEYSPKKRTKKLNDKQTNKPSIFNFRSIKSMAISNLLTFTNSLLLAILAILAILCSNGFPNLFKPQSNQTNIVIYVHDYFTGEDASAIAVGGRKGSESNVLEFGTLIVVDDPVTEGPRIDSREIGRAQGMYINSQSDGKGLYMVFSVIFTGGEFRGSSLEIQGSDLFTLKEREFGVVSGTGFFRFVKGFGIMQTENMDLVHLRAVIKLNITVKHY
ncbi:dirigent protein 11-like [Cucurbita pepo subsp. pepo]|uniref:dirigent protein 11-like n=1 Tax=Cucurbita pepo subsp. pepo TaxID=3664 RepID=UPI000C9D7F54|nr:dirigent protein 11-like [Cucurbita pepo subsp. pepo]